MVKRKAPEGAHEEHADETWLIPYSDLLTLLLALFIVLFASSSLDKDKMEKIEYAFAAAFNAIPGEQMNGSILNFLEDVKDLHLGDNVGLGSDSKGAVINIATVTLFDNKSATLKEDANEILQPLANLLKTDKYKRYRIVIEGHTDDQEIISSQYASNWELSSVQAGAVVRRFIKLGLDENRFQAVGMAGISPQFPNYDAYGQPIPKNRKLSNRIEIHIEI